MSQTVQQCDVHVPAHLSHIGTRRHSTPTHDTQTGSADGQSAYRSRSEFRRQTLIAEATITNQRARILPGGANAREAFFPGHWQDDARKPAICSRARLRSQFSTDLTNGVWLRGLQRIVLGPLSRLARIGPCQVSARTTRKGTYSPRKRI
jgi:hypothetical protein